MTPTRISVPLWTAGAAASITFGLAAAVGQDLADAAADARMRRAWRHYWAAVDAGKAAQKAAAEAAWFTAAAAEIRAELAVKNYLASTSGKSGSASRGAGR